jgi:NAD(P) transhydrogenase subunit beta
MSTLIYLAYLVSIVFFILGLKLLGSARTARRGNLLSMIGMLIAIVVTLLDRQIVSYTWIIVGVLVGGAIGVVAGRKVKMTAMPQMVALFNAFGGGASALVVLTEFLRTPGAAVFGSAARTVSGASGLGLTVGITMALGLFIGMVTLTGSLIAFAKLQELMRGAPIVFKGQTVVNGLILALILAGGVFFALNSFGYRLELLLGVLVLSAVLGITLVIPVGGADMPVIIALLNSYSGLAAAAAGFAINNYVLIVSGALVGASGIILTSLMCRAMNRSLGNVLFGAVGTEISAAAGEQRQVIRYTPADAAAMLENAMSVIVVPGYGLAVAQAQYALQEAVELLRKNGTTVNYAIHPVAGRMPGHMNVLLAEASVPYELLKDMEEINEEFGNTDVVLVAGANDVVNPSAREKGNPLSGMPILQADKAQTVIIVKRSLSPGFSGVDNPLFYDPKTLMVFGDAKDVLTKIGLELKKGG